MNPFTPDTQVDIPDLGLGRWGKGGLPPGLSGMTGHSGFGVVDSAQAQAPRVRRWVGFITLGEDVAPGIHCC